jgi:hypothetical protein
MGIEVFIGEPAGRRRRANRRGGLDGGRGEQQARKQPGAVAQDPHSFTITCRTTL